MCMLLPREYSGQRKLPPPIDGRTFLQELPGYLQQSRLGSQLNTGAGTGGLSRGEMGSFFFFHLQQHRALHTATSSLPDSFQLTPSS